MKNNDKLRVGVIGLGHQSFEDHIPAVLASRDVELVAVCDVDDEKLEQFSNQNTGIGVYKKYNDLLNNEKLDFVIIAVPHYLHSEIVKESIKCGVHVLKEKPFATSIEEARELADLSKKNKIIISLTLQRRFNPIYYTFFQFIDKIGTPFFIDAKYTFYTDFPEAGWRGQKKFAGGGCLIDMGYHVVDLLMWYFGLPDQVWAESSCVAKEGCVYDAEDTAQVLFRYSKKDLFGSMLLSRVIFPKNEYFDVYGTRGIIHIERGKIERRASDGTVIESLLREYKWPSAAQDQIDFFAKIVRGEKDNISGPDTHFNHMAFIEASYQSINSKKFVNPSIFIRTKPR